MTDSIKVPAIAYYQKQSDAFIKAQRWLKRHGNNGYLVFDYPEYAGMPDSITYKLDSDEVDHIQAHWVAHKCEIRWCKSKKTASWSANENIDDGCYSVQICESCAKKLGFKDKNSSCNDLPEPDTVEKLIKEKNYA